MRQQITLALQFYRLLWLYNMAFTIVGTALVQMSAGHLTDGVFLTGKIVGYAGALGLYHFSSQQSYYYFRNAGFNLKPIITITFFIDIIVYLLIISIITLISLCSHLF